MGICCAMVGVWFLEVGASLLLLPFAGAGENPNNAELLRMGAEEPGKVRALAVFLAPVAEEVLFRVLERLSPAFMVKSSSNWSMSSSPWEYIATGALIMASRAFQEFLRNTL